MTEQATLIPTVAPLRMDVDLGLIIVEGNPLPPPDKTLVESIRRHGLQHPLTVSYREGERSSDGVTLIAGRRRLAALYALEYPTAPVLAYREGEVNGDAVSLAENAVRGPNPIEEMDRLVNLFGTGKSEEDVVEITGMSKGTIRKRMRLTSLIRPAVALVVEGKIGIDTAEKMAGLHKDVQQTLLEQADDGKVTGPMVREATTAAKQKIWGALRMDEVDAAEDAPAVTTWQQKAEYHLEQVLAALPPDQSALRNHLLAGWALLR